MDPAAPAQNAAFRHARWKGTTRSNQKQELPTTGQTPKAHGIAARLLAEALQLSGDEKAAFEVAARGGAEIAISALQTSRAGGAAAATRTLPRDIASFIGRKSELSYLVTTVAEATSRGEVVNICAIGGMAGIGKTALAVHAAHRIAARYPDGQYFLPLHAHTPGHQPVDPADALAALLQMTGMPAQQIPTGLQPRESLWRDRVAGKRLLLLLDDAAGHEQVRPLLPGTAETLVLITSRSRLTALEGSEVLSLDKLPAGDAAELFVRLAARHGLAPGDAAVQQIAKLCGHLPLAVGMLARQLYHHRAWTAAELAADLAAAQDRLALINAGNMSVAAAFDLSYQDLPPDQQRLFRRLGLHPGTEFNDYAAAALDGSDLTTVRRNLNGLYDHYLLTELPRRRYRMHDLIGEHARTLAAADPSADRDAAVTRVLDFYMHTASIAGRFTTWRTSIAIPVPTGPPPAWAQELPTREEAIAWLETEHANLRACLDHAVSHAGLTHVIGITIAISEFLHTQGHWDEAVELSRIALNAALEAKDQQGQAWVLNQRGIAQERSGEYEAAEASQRQALKLFCSTGDRHGQACALNQLGLVQRLTGKYPEAEASQRQALKLFGNLRDVKGQAATLNQIAVIQRLTGDLHNAAISQFKALRLFRRTGDRQGQAWTLEDLGMVQQLAGDHQAADASLTKALRLFRRTGDRQGQARALNQLGVIQQLAGDHQAADASLTKALELYEDLGDRHGQAEVALNLGKLRSASPPHRDAHGYYDKALRIARNISAPDQEARALEGIGRSHIREGNLNLGAKHLQQALAIYRRIEAPEAQLVETTLRDLH